MTKTKKTLGLLWKRYHNHYRMTHKLHQGIKDLGWMVQTIQSYNIEHTHEVNEEMAVRHQDNPPDLPDPDDMTWLQQHPELKGSGKAPRKQL